MEEKLGIKTLRFFLQKNVWELRISVSPHNVKHGNQILI